MAIRSGVNTSNDAFTVTVTSAVQFDWSLTVTMPVYSSLDAVARTITLAVSFPSLSTVELISALMRSSPDSTE